MAEQIVGLEPTPIDESGIPRVTYSHPELASVALVDDLAASGQILGVHMAGDRVGELIGEAQVLYNLGVKPAEVARFIHAHSTQNEARGEALLAVSGAPLHTHG